MLAVTVLAALGWLFSRGAVGAGPGRLPPLFFVGVRFCLAGLLLAALSRRELLALPRAHLGRGLLTGAAMALGTVCWVQGLYRSTGIGVGAFINSLGVVLIPVVGWILFRAPASARTWLAMAVGAVGLGFLTVRHGVRLAASDAWYAASACANALHFNLSARFSTRMPVRALTSLQLLVVGVLGLVLSAQGEAWPRTASPATLCYLLAAILLCTCLRFGLLVKSQSVAPAGHGPVVMAVEPVWTALLGALLLAERMTPWQVLGGALVAAALVVNRLGPGYPSFVSEEG
jgi:drug/metabolite transporter (DMT)-like permease